MNPRARDINGGLNLIIAWVFEHRFFGGDGGYSFLFIMSGMREVKCAIGMGMGMDFGHMRVEEMTG